MAQTALNCLVSGAEVGHRIANGRVREDGASRMPARFVDRAVSGAEFGLASERPTAGGTAYFEDALAAIE